MSWSNLLTIIPVSPLLSAIIWLVAAVVLLYFARTPAHQALTAMGHVVRDALRLSAHSIMLAERRLQQRNREVLLAEGAVSTERAIEREFRRIEVTAQQNLDDFPSIQRRLTEQVTEIDEEYRAATEVLPAVPGWVEAVEAIAKVKVKSEPGVAEVLGIIQQSLEQSADKALHAYRAASKERHRLLKRMMPHWRSLATGVLEVEKSINGILSRSRLIDQHMEYYAEIQKGSDRAIRTLSSSSLTQLFISSFVLMIAIGGAVINFNLIAYPMQEMVGGNSYIGAFQTADVAAMVIILIEVAMGLFLMESLRITRLFPVINALDDRMRVRMIWFTLTILVILASVEASLAYMRDMIAADAEALRQSLASAAVATTMDSRWIPTVGQMTMGFILPFALTFVAIPLESFIHSSRTVVGMAGTTLLRTLALLLRFVGNLAFRGTRMVIRLYDLLIFGPLWVEERLQRRTGQEETQSFDDKVKGISHLLGEAS